MTPESVEPITFVGTEYASERITHLQRKREIAAQSEASVRLSGGALSDAAHAIKELWITDQIDLDEMIRRTLKLYVPELSSDSESPHHS